MASKSRTGSGRKGADREREHAPPGRKSLYDLSRLHSQGLLNRGDYLEARRVLLNDILGGQHSLGQDHYATLADSSDAEVHYSEAAIAERRRETREQLARLGEFREFANRARMARRRRLRLWIAAGVAGALLLGILGYLSGR